MKSHMTGGVGNAGNTTIYETIKITINQSIEFEAYVGFTAGLEAQGLGLLGQSGFLAGTEFRLIMPGRSSTSICHSLSGNCPVRLPVRSRLRLHSPVRGC